MVWWRNQWPRKWTNAWTKQKIVTRMRWNNKNSNNNRCVCVCFKADFTIFIAFNFVTKWVLFNTLAFTTWELTVFIEIRYRVDDAHVTVYAHLGQILDSSTPKLLSYLPLCLSLTHPFHSSALLPVYNLKTWWQIENRKKTGETQRMKKKPTTTNNEAVPTLRPFSFWET